MKHVNRYGLSRWQWWLIILAAIIALLLAVHVLLNRVVFQPVPNPNYGVSFSIKQAQDYYKMDWRANFTALLDDLQFRRFRLMSYWYLIEPTRGQFDFADLDWQMDEAAKRGAKVSLSVGLRQPRWPECHPPIWARELRGHEYNQALFAYMELVINRYKNHPALQSWQLENEFLNNRFGTCEVGDRERVVEEFNLIKQWDPNHPIQMTLSDEHGLPLGDPKPDAFGFTMYRTTYNTYGPRFYMTFPATIWWHRLRAAIIHATYPDKPITVHELQMEAWGPTENYYMSIKEQNKSMSTTQIDYMTDFARRSGFNEIDLWGSEWWWWRKTNGDPSIWEAVRQTINKP